ncbi:MAG TPA: hypothetical protein VK255_00440 [Patescibacteria group bacterium]|nr:hypothetical protein [Patescibacteria group bacterium]
MKIFTLVKIVLIIFVAGTFSCSSTRKHIHPSPSIAYMNFENGYRIISTDGRKEIQKTNLRELDEEWQEFASKIPTGEAVQVKVFSISNNGKVDFDLVEERDSELFEICKEGE